MPTASAYSSPDVSAVTAGSVVGSGDVPLAADLECGNGSRWRRFAAPKPHRYFNTATIDSELSMIQSTSIGSGAAGL